MTSRAQEYAGGDEAFAEWLDEIDQVVLRKLGLSVFDLPDMMFRDNFEADIAPGEFVRNVVAHEVLMGGFGEGAYQLLMTA